MNIEENTIIVLTLKNSKDSHIKETLSVINVEGSVVIHTHLPCANVDGR